MQKNSTARILVLDDDPFILKLLARMLGGLGFTSVTACDNGPAALQQMDRPDGIPNLILLDLNMPGMDGAEFVHKLVERRYTGSLILVSGEDQRVLQTAQKMVQEHKIPLLGRLSKPVTPETLATILEKWAAPAQAGSRIYGTDELRTAIADGELVNHYQPKVEVATGKFVGVEALVRWNHPVDGMVLPDRFIGVAETYGLIDDLTRTVLTGALTQAQDWQKAGLSPQLSVNVSMDNLASPDFADAVAQLAAKANVPPQQVVLEVTERRLLQEELRVPLETLTRLRLKRFRLSLDNFGTGHVPLSRLRDIPFDELKIDRSIMHGACTDDMLHAKYDTSLATSRELRMEAVAVGAETLDDWNLLRRTGCNFAQGYFIAKPMPAADLPAWMAGWQKRISNGYRD
jgi:EAL domain-containing protein (putative c-di-GMP-specific phosphodiesterase class I)/ActR/RegA family two-component response regulator